MTESITMTKIKNITLFCFKLQQNVNIKENIKITKKFERQLLPFFSFKQKVTCHIKFI